MSEVNMSLDEALTYFPELFDKLTDIVNDNIEPISELTLEIAANDSLLRECIKKAIYDYSIGNEIKAQAVKFGAFCNKEEQKDFQEACLVVDHYYQYLSKKEK